MRNLSVSFYSLHQACHIHKTLFLIAVEKFFVLFYCIWFLWVLRTTVTWEVAKVPLLQVAVAIKN